MKHSTVNEIRQKLDLIAEIPNRVETLENYERAELISFIKKEKEKLYLDAINTAKNNHGYNYPSNVLSFNERVNYWFDSIQIGIYSKQRIEFIESLLLTSTKENKAVENTQNTFRGYKMNSIEQIISINIDNYIKYYNELTNISDISFIGSSYIKNNVSENWRKKFPDSKNGNYQLETGEKLSIEPVFYPGELFNWNKAKEKIKAIVGNYQDQNKETLLTSKEVFYSLQLELELNFEFKFIEFILHSKYIPVFAVEFMAFGENGYIDKILNSKNKKAIDSTIKRLNEIFEFYLIKDLSQIAIIQHLYKTVEANHNKETTPKQSKNRLTFEKLFRNRETAQQVKTILETHGYTKNGVWVYDGNLNVIGAAYSSLKENSKIQTGNKTPQLKTWCEEFGIIAYSKKVPNAHVTIKNLLVAKNHEALKEFNRIFSTIK